MHLKGMSELQSLDLAGTAITDKGLTQLKGLANLRLLNLKGTKITAEGIAKLQQTLPNLKIVH